MSKDFRPRDYQRAVIDHIVEHERCNVWAGMGTGKTASTLTALDALALVDDPFPALVLAPLRVASSTWPDEIRKWAHLHHLHHEVAAGGVGPMREALRHTGADLVTLNYDNAAALVEHCGERWPFNSGYSPPRRSNRPAELPPSHRRPASR
jgi:SNF2 family DNA or RNA helicase